jgi:hypothetical protein
VKRQARFPQKAGKQQHGGCDHQDYDCLFSALHARLLPDFFKLYSKERAAKSKAAQVSS